MVSNGNAALEAALSREFNLVLDLGLPGMNGQQVLLNQGMNLCQDRHTVKLEMVQ